MKLGKMKYRGTIAVDIDGVLADWETPMCDAFGYVNRHMYSPYDRYPDVDRGLIEEFIANPDNYVDLEPIFGGLLFCRQAFQRGWYIWLCTARPESVWEVTKEWLNKYPVMYHEVSRTSNKADTILAFNKANPDKEVRIAVDDSVSVLRSLPTRVYPVAFHQLWNNGFYPEMWYDEEEMKLMIIDNPSNESVGVWDKVGK